MSAALIKDIDDVNKHNEQSIIALKLLNATLVADNPDFFDPDIMYQYGYQTFGIITTGARTYLTVDRSILMGTGQRVELNTSFYEIDDNNILVKMVGCVRKKIVKIVGR